MYMYNGYSRLTAGDKKHLFFANFKGLRSCSVASRVKSNVPLVSWELIMSVVRSVAHDVAASVAIQAMAMKYKRLMKCIIQNACCKIVQLKIRRTEIKAAPLIILSLVFLKN